MTENEVLIQRQGINMENENSFIESLIAVQKELPTLKKDKDNPFFKSKYVPLEQVLGAILPILNKHGFALVQEVGMSGSRGETRVSEPSLKTILLHESGRRLESTMLLLLKSSDPQAQGSAITYARRYALMAMLGLTGEDEDDDAEATRPKQTREAPKPKPTSGLISEPQRKRLFAIAKEREKQTGIPAADLAKEAMAQVLGEYAPESTKDIKKADYEAVCERVESLDIGDFGGMDQGTLE